jgi:hypothetical protein
MARAGRALIVVAALAAAVQAAQAADPLEPWDGVNPFQCRLQQAGFDGKGPQPEADPYCIEFDKRRQNVTQLGLVEFLGKEPERAAAASPKCFYFQSDHWRGSVVQEDASTKTYEWDGHYFFDKARGEGGVWVSNFNFGGQTGDPRDIPGFPDEWKPYFREGTGGFRGSTVEADPRCAERAEREGGRMYAGATGSRSPCMVPGGGVRRGRLGPARLGESESELRRALGPPRRVKRGFLRWCVEGGGRFLAGQRSDRSGDLGEGSTERAVVLVSSSRAFRFRGVGPGARLRSLNRRLPRAVGLVREARTRVFAVRRGSRVILGVRGGRVRYIGVRNRRALGSKHALKRYLRRAR